MPLAQRSGATSADRDHGIQAGKSDAVRSKQARPKSDSLDGPQQNVPRHRSGDGRAMGSGVAPSSDFAPNTWNVNSMTGFEYAKLLESMQRWGFSDPVTVRQHPAGTPRFELIDGEHRWRAATDLGLDIAYFDVSPISDTEAIALGLALNELRGRHDPRQLGDLLKGLLSGSSPDAVLKGLPFTDDALKGLIGLKDFDWGSLEEKPKRESPRKGERWVEKTWRFPPDAMEVINDAIARVRETEEGIEEWQAIEMIAADFLAG